jgi:hypothetical protein
LGLGRDMSKLQVAALISGEPRFSEELDHFIKHLTGYASITWFFFLWKTPKNDSIKLLGCSISTNDPMFCS